jgi:WD40 repeat protein
MLRYLSILFFTPQLLLAQAPKAEVVTYKDQAQAILRKYCLNCHNPDKASSDLDVSTYRALMAGGASGEAVKPGNSGQSLLYKVTAHEAEPKMPPKGVKIPDADLLVLKKWIDQGASETAVGAAKNAMRKLDIDPVVMSLGKPNGLPPMPGQLPSFSHSKTARPHPITAMTSSPWAPLLAVAGHERVLLYNTETLKFLGSLAFPERIPHVLKFSRNGKWLLAAGGRGAVSGKVVIWDVVTGKRVTEIGDEADLVLAADVSPHHKFVALGGPGKLIKIYDTASGELKHKIKKHTDWVTAISFSPDGTFLATGDRNGGAFLWEPETGGIVFTLGDHKDSITELSWRADSQMLATASEDGKVILWMSEDGFPSRTLTNTPDLRAAGPARSRPAGILSVDFSRTGNLLTSGRDLTAKLWNVNGSPISKFEGFTDLPTKVAFNSEATRVFVGDFTGQVKVWSIPGSKLLGVLTPSQD